MYTPDIPPDIQRGTKHRLQESSPDVALANHSPAVEALSLLELTNRIRQERQHYVQGNLPNSAYGYELLRRAIMDEDERAWNAIYVHYAPLVTGWIKRHSAFAACEEDEAYFANRSVEKFWVTMTPHKFREFPTLSHLLRYLKMCVHSTLIDHVRAQQRRPAETAYEVVAASHHANADRTASQPSTEVQLTPSARGQTYTIEDSVMAREHYSELWSSLSQRTRNYKEELVVYASFILALPPRNLYSHFSDEFQNVREVYAIKQNILTRLRRDEQLYETLAAAQH